GALMIHAGEEVSALELARRTIDAFERTNVDTIVTNAAGCGSNIKEYGHLLRDDPAYRDRAKAFAAKCKDVSEVLTELPLRAERRPIQRGIHSRHPVSKQGTTASPLRVAFHDSCHLQHAQGVRSEPRTLLSQIPGVQLLEIPEGPICCGSAGIYNLLQP